MTLGQQILLTVASFVANWFSALAGGGAGLLQFPLLIFLGLPFSVALATHKLASVALGLGATLRHWRSSQIDRRFAAIILGAGLPGVVVGARAILFVPEHAAKLALGAITIALGVYSFLRPRLGQEYRPKNQHGSGLFVGVLGLFLIGLLNGSLASGTGLLLTMWLVLRFGLDYKRAIAYTLILCGLGWNGVGAMVLGAYGQIAWSWMPALLVGSVLGGYLGTHFALKRSNTFIKHVFELITIVVGIKLMLG